MRGNAINKAQRREDEKHIFHNRLHPLASHGVSRKVFFIKFSWHRMHLDSRYFISCSLFLAKSDFLLLRLRFTRRASAASQMRSFRAFIAWSFPLPRLFYQSSRIFINLLSVLLLLWLERWMKWRLRSTWRNENGVVTVKTNLWSFRRLLMTIAHSVRFIPERGIDQTVKEDEAERKKFSVLRLRKTQTIPRDREENH